MMCMCMCICMCVWHMYLCVYIRIYVCYVYLGVYVCLCLGICHVMCEIAFTWVIGHECVHMWIYAHIWVWVGICTLMGHMLICVLMDRLGYVQAHVCLPTLRGLHVWGGCQIGLKVAVELLYGSNMVLCGIGVILYFTRDLLYLAYLSHWGRCLDSLIGWFKYTY
jgi:hypothetical protein